MFQHNLFQQEIISNPYFTGLSAYMQSLQNLPPNIALSVTLSCKSVNILKQIRFSVMTLLGNWHKIKICIL